MRSESEINPSLLQFSSSVDLAINFYLPLFASCRRLWFKEEFDTGNSLAKMNSTSKPTEREREKVDTVKVFLLTAHRKAVSAPLIKRPRGSVGLHARLFSALYVNDSAAQWQAQPLQEGREWNYSSPSITAFQAYCCLCWLISTQTKITRAGKCVSLPWHSLNSGLPTSVCSALTHYYWAFSAEKNCTLLPTSAILSHKLNTLPSWARWKI